MEGQELKVRENRLRRMADRQGLQLMKSHTRDPHSLTFGTYMLVDIVTNAVAFQGDNTAGRGYGLSLNEVEACLTTPKPTK